MKAWPSLLLGVSCLLLAVALVGLGLDPVVAALIAVGAGAALYMFVTPRRRG